jgi:SSS family solute:Na+ symporter
MLLGIVIVILSVLNGHGGFMNAVRQLSEIPSDNPITMGQQGAFASFFGPDPVGLLYVIILTSLGTWGLPQMVQKFYAIKSEKAVATGTIVSTFFAVVIAGGSYFLGGFARLIDVSLVSKTNPDGTLAMMYDHVMPQLLSNLPDILMGVLIVLIMSASMSTLSSLVLTSSSTMTLDFLKGTVMKKMTEKQQLWWLRAFVIFFIVISVAIAMNPPTFIAQLMGISWGALAGAFLAPFMYGLYWKGVTKAAVWVSFIYGVGLTVANMYTAWMSPIQAGAIAMLGGLVLVPLVSLATPKLDKNLVEGIFACYDVEVDTTTKNRLPDEEDVD